MALFTSIPKKVNLIRTPTSAYFSNSHTAAPSRGESVTTRLEQTQKPVTVGWRSKWKCSYGVMCAAVGCNNYVGTTTGLSFFRLTERHITLPAFSSMKVSLAAQVLSHSVAAGITTLCMISDKLDSEAIHTAKFLEQFNKLFDVFNSRTMAGPNNFSRGITAESNHVSFLKECLQWLETVTPLGKSGVLPCLEGWKMCINSLLQLWEFLENSHSLKFLLTNRLNQDCLDNFFSVMRNRGGHRDNPNSVEFRTGYRAVAINSLFVKSQNTNCIEDIDSFLLKLGNFASSTLSPPVPLPDTNTALPLVSQDLAAVSNMPPNVTPREGNIIVYLAGYVGRKAVLKFKCKDCRALWKKQDESSHSDLYTFINNKQYDDLKVCGGGAVLPKYCICGLHNLQVPLAIHRPKIGLHFMSKVKDASSISSVTCSNIVYVHIGAILYGAIVLYCQDSPSSSGTKQANTAP